MLRHPVVMLSGLIVPTSYYDKFTCIPDYFKNWGVDFYVYQRNNDMAMRHRLGALKTFFLTKWPAGKKFHLLGHSAGGLDARNYLHDTGDDRCISMLTIGTPHRGTPIANEALDPRSKIKTNVLNFLFSQYKNARDAVYEMTPEHMTAFNDRVKNIQSCKYGSLLFDIDWYKATPTSWENYFLLKEKGYESNDGTVPTFSQAWGTPSETIFKGSHLSQLAPIRYGGKMIWKNTIDQCVKYFFQSEEGHR